MSIWHIVMLSAGVIHPLRRTRSVATSGPIDRKSVSERIILSASSAGASFLRTASRAETVRPRQGVPMSALIHPKTITVDGLSVRYAEGGQDGPDAILMSPWPESVYAFEPAWPHLAAAAHLVAIDPPASADRTTAKR